MWRTSSGSGAEPSSGSMVSLTSIAPLYKINSDTAMPISPSVGQSRSQVSMAAIKTTLVVITSLRASAAVASSVSESMRRPMVRLRWLIHSLTRMDATSTTTVSQPKPTGVGSSVFWQAFLEQLHADD